MRRTWTVIGVGDVPGRECGDKLAADEISWFCGGKENWKNGGAAAVASRLTSFDVADEIVRALAQREIFPNLRSIVIAGHSAGGQFERARLSTLGR